MKISTKGLYAVRFMVFLAGKDAEEAVPLKKVSSSTGISRKYLEQIATSLASAGLVRSTRGAQGGYRLAKGAHAVTLFDVLLVTEGSLATVDFLDDFTEQSPGETTYEVLMWRGLYRAITDYLQGITLQDVLDRSTELAIDSYSI